MNTIETLTEVFALASGAVDLADKLIEVTKGKGRKFADSLQNRFYNSTTISEFEEWDLWTLNESGDCSGTEQEALFWRKVKEEEED